MLSSPGAGLGSIFSGKAIGLFHAGDALNLTSYLKLDIIHNFTSVKEPNDFSIFILFQTFSI